MRKQLYFLSRIVITLGISSLLLPINAASSATDPKKSQLAFQRGQRADQAGKREDAMAAYAEAVDADPSNSAAWRARGRDYMVAGDLEKAIADFEESVKQQP